MQAWPPDRLRAILGVSKLVAPLHTDSLAVANRDKHKHIHALKQRIAEAVVLGSIGGFLRDGVANSIRRSRTRSPNLDRVRARADEFDVLHFHVDVLHYPIIRDFLDRTVTTMHGRLDREEQRLVHSIFADVPLVSISNDQHRSMPCRSRTGWAPSTTDFRGTFCLSIRLRRVIC